MGHGIPQQGPRRLDAIALLPSTATRHSSRGTGLHPGWLGWLEGPAAVAPVMLNRPERIRALGPVMILALMVRNHPQFTLRAQVRTRGVGVQHPFRKKEDFKLTTEMALESFGGVQVVFVSLENAPWQCTVPELPDEAVDILSLLDLEQQIYAGPPPRRRGRRGHGNPSTVSTQPLDSPPEPPHLRR